MRRRRGLAWVVFFMVLSPAAAFSQSGRPALHAHGGYAFPEENNIRGGFESGFGFAYPLAGKWALSFEFSHWRGTATESPGKLRNGKVTVSPVLICLQLEFLKNRFFFPYAFAGGAFVFTRFNSDPYASIPEVKLDQKIEDGLGLVFGIGARIPLSSILSFFGEVSYIRRTASAETIVDDMNKGISYEPFVANLRTIFLKFGLKLFF